ncbi:hypothetical protein GCM10020256_24060 [Streptomyces thermocoprophilus]
MSSLYDAYRMNTILSYATVLILFLLLTAPALVGWVHERRIDRQLAATRPARPARPARAAWTQKSSSRSTVPSTATWYAEGRRSKKLVSS